MHHSGRGIRVTLTAAALTALVAVAAVPSVFAGSLTNVTSGLTGKVVGTTVTAGQVVGSATTATAITTASAGLTNAFEITFPAGTNLTGVSDWEVTIGGCVLPSTGSYHGSNVVYNAAGNAVRLETTYASCAGETVSVAIGTGSMVLPPADGLISVTSYANGTPGVFGSGTVVDTGWVDMGLVAATCPTGTIYGAGGYLSACPATLPADGTSRSTVTVNTANLGTLTGTLVLTTSVNSGTFVGPVTVTSGAGAWNPTPSVTSTIVTGTKPTGTGTSTLSLQAPTANGSSVLQLYFTPTGGSQQQLDTLTITYRTPGTGQGPFGREHERGARKVAFYATTGATTCAAAPITPASGAAKFGFAVVNSTGNGRLNIEVSLKGVAPGTYNVYVDQAGTCGSTAFTLRTNSRGNGNRHISVPSTGAGQVWLTAVQTAGGSNVFVTTAATVVVKGHASKDHGNGKDNPGRGRGHD